MTGKSELCAYCGESLTGSSLHVNDPNGPSGTYHIAPNCYELACRASASTESGQIRRVGSDVASEATGDRSGQIDDWRASQAHPGGLLHPTAYFDAKADRPVPASGRAIPGKSRRVARRPA
jgi:hypothetical protein